MGTSGCAREAISAFGSQRRLSKTSKGRTRYLGWMLLGGARVREAVHGSVSATRNGNGTEGRVMQRTALSATVHTPMQPGHSAALPAPNILPFHVPHHPRHTSFLLSSTATFHTHALKLIYAFSTLGTPISISHLPPPLSLKGNPLPPPPTLPTPPAAQEVGPLPAPSLTAIGSTKASVCARGGRFTGGRVGSSCALSDSDCTGQINVQQRRIGFYN